MTRLAACRPTLRSRSISRKAKSYADVDRGERLIELQRIEGDGFAFPQAEVPQMQVAMAAADVAGGGTFRQPVPRLLRWRMSFSGARPRRRPRAGRLPGRSAHCPRVMRSSVPALSLVLDRWQSGVVGGDAIAEVVEKPGGEGAVGRDDIEEVAPGNGRHAQDPVDRVVPAKFQRAVGTRGTRRRHRGRCRAPLGLLRTSSRRRKWARASGVEKSRNGIRTAFFSFQTVSVPMKTAEMWVSFGGPPDSSDRKRATSCCSAGMVMPGSSWVESIVGLRRARTCRSRG